MQMIILGMHRSGTSLIARLINMMGAYCGPEKAALGFAPDNPKGFWERRDVMHLNDSLLALNGCAWNQLARWPEQPAPLEPPKIRQIRSLVMDLDAHRPWMLKDPRLCLTLPYWKPYLEVPVCVIVHRNPLESALSLEKRDNIPAEYGLAMWEYHAVGLLNSTHDLPCIYASHADALADPVAFTHRLHAALEREDVRGLRQPSRREILAFVDPALHRAKTESGDMRALSPHRQMLVSLLTGETRLHGPVDVSEPARACMQKPYA